jgi:hypothetical protein
MHGYPTSRRSTVSVCQTPPTQPIHDHARESEPVKAIPVGRLIAAAVGHHIAITCNESGCNRHENGRGHECRLLGA